VARHRYAPYERLTEPLVRAGGELRPASWDEALRRAADELGELPSVLDYERIAAGRSDLPSSTTIRNRLGRWSSLTARLAAQRELARQVQVRAQSAAGALVRA